LARSDKKELNEKELKQLETLAGFGIKVEQMAAIFDMSKKTFERRMAENGGDNPLNDALLKGRSKAATAVTKTAYQMAVSGKHPNMTIFWLKCRQNWKDKQEIDLNSNVAISFDKQDKDL
jgi:AraC-like DNA-binding protein